MAQELPHTDPPYPDRINKHLVTVEGDILLVRFIGPYQPDEARTITAIMDRIQKERGRVCFLGDLTHAVAPGPGTRRVFVEWQHAGEFPNAAYFGAIWPVRTVAILIHSAMRLMGKKPAPSYYSKTEAEARAWLSEQRQAPTQS